MSINIAGIAAEFRRERPFDCCQRPVCRDTLSVSGSRHSRITIERRRGEFSIGIGDEV
jgi:hypothetical protein